MAALDSHRVAVALVRPLRTSEPSGDARRLMLMVLRNDSWQWHLRQVRWSRRR